MIPSSAADLELLAMHLRIDSIEHALRAIGQGDGPGGYLAAYAVAEDNLRLGHAVVADCVNPLAITRQAWRDAAARAGARIVELEVICSDPGEHRRRVEERAPDLPGQRLPTWAGVQARAVERWDRATMRIDTAGQSLDGCVARVLAALNPAALD